jgi:peptide/nickel transport system permease protein
MLTFIVRRILAGVVVLFVVSILAFYMLSLSSGSVARALLGETATEQQVKLKNAQLGLDRSVVVRYFDWLGHALHGDLGTSWFTSEPVFSTITGRLPTTLSVVAVTILVVSILSVLLGVTAAVNRGWVDRTLQIVSIGGASIPQFVVAIVLVTVFAIKLGWFRATGYVPLLDDPSGWVGSISLPVIALAIGAVASSAQQFRSATINELSKDYVRTLRSRGLGSGEILFFHVLRGAAPAGLTILSLQFIGLLGADVIIEQIFALPGIGFLAVQSTIQGDSPVLMGVVITTVVIVVIVNLVVDLIVGWLNPKARVS